MRAAYIGSRARRALSGPADPYYANVVLLLNPSGADGATLFSDQGPNTKAITVVGDAQIDTGVTLFGYPTMLFDGTGDYLSVANTSDFDILGGDFTFEMFLRPSASGSWWPMGKGNASTVPGSAFSFYNGGTWDFYSGASAFSLTRPTLTAGTMDYIGVKRSGTTVEIWKNGTLFSSVTIGTSVVNSVTNPLTIGSYAGGGFPGNMGPLRITRGVARDLSVVPVDRFPNH